MENKYNLNYFSKTNWSLVLIKNKKIIYRSKLRRLKPLIACIGKHEKDMRGAIVYDKKIGRAAAILLIYAKVSEIWTPLASLGGKKYLARHKVKFIYKRLVRNLMNDKGTGPCPMEKMSKEITEKGFIDKMLK
jgi:hypothetical protein